MKEKFHIKATRADGTVIVDTDYVCMYGAINCGDGTHIGVNNGCCSGGDRLTTLKCLYDNLVAVAKDIIDEAPFMAGVVESILLDDSDSPVKVARKNFAADAHE